MDTLYLFIAVTLALITTAQGVSNCTNGDVELIQDQDDIRIVGYVQYCFRGEWGRLCREDGHMTLWDNSEAEVACRQLGYISTGYAYVSHDSTWTGGFVSLNCMNGMESSLEDCMPLRVITDREDSCKSGNHARLLCEPETTSSRQPFPTTMSPTTNNPHTVDATTMISNFCQSCDGTVNTVLGATVGVLLVLLLVTVVALVNTCVALRLKNKQSKQGELYLRDNRQDNPDGKGTEVNPAYDAVKYTQGEETYETVH